MRAATIALSLLLAVGATRADDFYRWRDGGLHRDPPAPTAPAAQVQVLPRVHHLQLTRDPAIYEQISAWCGRAPQE